MGTFSDKTSVLIRRGKFGQSREDHVKMEADTGVMQLQVKEHLGLLATTRNWERSKKYPSLEPSEAGSIRENMALPVPLFQTCSL